MGSPQLQATGQNFNVMLRNKDLASRASKNIPHKPTITDSIDLRPVSERSTYPLQN